MKLAISTKYYLILFRAVLIGSKSLHVQTPHSLYFCHHAVGVLTLVTAGGDGALALLANQRLVDVGDDTTAGNGGLDQGVQLLVTTDGKLKIRIVNYTPTTSHTSGDS